MGMWNNSAFRRLVPARRFPSIPLTILIAIGLSVIAAVYATYAARTHFDTLSLGFYLVDHLVLLGIMALAGLAAVILVTRDLRGSDTPSDSTNGLTKRERVWGYVVGALYRLRVLFAFIVAVSVAGMVFNHEALRYFATERCLIPAYLSEAEDRAYEVVGEYDWEYRGDDDLSAVVAHMNSQGLQCVEPSDPRLVRWVLSDFLTHAGLWGMALLGVIAGVWMAVVRRWSVAPLVFVLLFPCGVLGVILLTLLGPVISPCGGPMITTTYPPYAMPVGMRSCDIVWAWLPNRFTNGYAISIPLALGALFVLSRKGTTSTS
jgi:hypothetical protein